MKAVYSDPVERVIDRLRISRRPRRIALFWPRDENGEPKLCQGQASEHLRPGGVRYRRYIRLRQRLRTCQTCGGSGSIEYETTATVPRCCGRSGWECGARGCTGPEPDVRVDHWTAPCPVCGGGGIRVGNGSDWYPGSR